MAAKSSNEASVVIVVDASSFDAIRDLTGAAGAGDGADLVFACFEEGFGDVAACMASDLGQRG